MPVYSISKEKLQDFLAKVIADSELIAPVKTDLVRFQKIGSPSEVYLKENSFFPLKEFFFRKCEPILSFDGKRVSAPLEKPKRERVFFGVRKCDLNAIRHQDIAFSENARDPYYHAQRENAILIGLHCNEPPSPYCFCGSLNLADFYDLMFFDKGGEFVVDVKTDKGKKFAKRYKQFFKPSKYKISGKDRKTPGTDRLKKKDISKLYDHPDWAKGVDLCLSCAACTNLCPTCYCFEFCEIPALLSKSKSERVRKWSSCQLKEFTRVAGGHVFREERKHRFKHRIYHQLQYFKDKHGVNLCVGCGRCIEACPTRIDFVKIINGMK